MNNFISKFPLLLLFGEPVSIEAVCAICLTPMVRDDGTLRQNLVATQGLKYDEPAGKEHQWLTHSMVDLCWPKDCFIPIFSAMFEMMVLSLGFSNLKPISTLPSPLVLNMCPQALINSIIFNPICQVPRRKKLKILMWLPLQMLFLKGCLGLRLKRTYIAICPILVNHGKPTYQWSKVLNTIILILWGLIRPWA